MADDRSLKYRADSRSVEEFAKDIKEGNQIEKEIIERYCQKNNLSWKSLGNDDGELKKKSRPIPDFLVEGVPLEVKFCRKKNSEFHLKKHHIDTYVEMGTKVLFVMAYDTETPKYTIIDPKDVMNNTITKFWNKLVYRCKTKDFEWSEL